MVAEAIVSTILGPLTSIVGREIQKEVRLVMGVRKEIKKLTSNFQAIQAVLVDAEQRQVKDKVVADWLDKLRDVSYDVLDEWNTAILKMQIEGVENASIPKKKVCLLFCCKRIALRRDIGLKIKKINENLDSIAKEKDTYNLNMSRSIEEPQRLKTTSFVDVSEIYGRDDEKNKEKGLHIISIVGMGGIGKTTLSQLVYNVEEVKNDVWTKEYYKLGPLYNSLNNGLHGSKILVMSRKATIARMMKSIDIINIEELSEDGNWFEKLEKIGGEIVVKCEGLPLALKTVGNNEIWKLEEFEQGFSPTLLLSCNDLPSMIKRCFSYCVIFPKDYNIRKNKLINLWMMEIIVEEYFGNLVMHSFFQEIEKDEYGNMNNDNVRCMIVHDFAQFLVKNECCAIEINGREEPIIYSSYKLNSWWSSSIEKIPGEVGKLTHLSSLESIKELPERLCELYNLQTLNISYCMSLENCLKGWEMNFVVDDSRDVSNVCTLECLKHLNHLRGSLILRGLGNVTNSAEAKNAQLTNKINLIALRLSFDKLYIDGYKDVKISPHWMALLTQLRKLSLSRCMGSVNRVGNEYLGIENMVMSLSSSSVIAFPKMNRLTFWDMRDWEDWDFGDYKERRKKIGDCSKLKALPDHLLQLSSLKKLAINRCSILKARYKVDKGENWQMISYILDTVFDNRNVQRNGD
ncbi:hypothetical protein ACOSP7_020435 [Xanthoceras sorbifolium]